jgi:hypothetical protein
MSISGQQVREVAISMLGVGILSTDTVDTLGPGQRGSGISVLLATQVKSLTRTVPL